MFRKNSASESGAVIPLLFILLVGIVFLAFQVYAVEAAPKMVFDAEVDAHRNVLYDVQEFDFSVRKAVLTGEAQPVVVGDHVEYPTLLSTPPKPDYAIRTTENENISIENFDRHCTVAEKAEGNGPDCDNEPMQYNMDTTTIIFLGNYNQFQNAHIYAYEYGTVYSAPQNTSEGGKGVISYGSQDIIDDNQITLFTFTGNFTAANNNVVHTTIFPESPEPLKFTVSENGKPVNLTIPTEMSKQEWEQMLGDERIENGGHIENLYYKNYTYYKDNSDNVWGGNKPGNAKQSHWYDCDHPGQGQPFVECTRDNSSNYLTIQLESGEEYTVTVFQTRLGDRA